MSVRQDGPDANDLVLDPLTSLFTRDWFFFLKDDRWKETAEQTITNGTLVEVEHKLNTAPNDVAGYLKCKVAEAGFAIDDRVALPAFEDGGADYGVQLTWNETNVGFTPGASGVRIMNKATGAMATITNASWRVVLRCKP